MSAHTHTHTHTHTPHYTHTHTQTQTENDVPMAAWPSGSMWNSASVAAA